VSEIRIEIDVSALESIARDPEILAVLVRKAQEVKAKAIALAPVKSGDYRSKFKLQSGVKDNKAFARVKNVDPAANVIELGARGGKNPKFRVLGRALEAVRE
jgi:nitrogen fixation protein FixH